MLGPHSHVCLIVSFGYVDLGVVLFNSEIK